MPKQGKNIYLRKDGRWEGRFIKDRIAGKAHYGYVFGKTYDEAELKLKAVSAENSLSAQGQEASFADLSNEWIQLKTPQLKASSIAKYANLLDLYLLPTFGDKSVSSISRSDLIKWSRELLAVGGAKSKGLAPKTVNSILSLMRNILEFASREKETPMWEFSGYFMSRDVHTTALSGNAYKALMTGKESNVESAHLNIWSINQADSINRILDNILYLSHPKAEMPALEGGFEKQVVTPTNLVSGFELPMVMGLPKKSVSGLAVVEMAEFGRSVVYENKIPKRSIEFGNIYHMGVVEKPRVKMDLDLLSSHCFITGSSGSGKSYGLR